MYPRRDDRTGLYGFWGRDGWAVHPQFKYAYGFAGGYAAVRLTDGRSGLMGLDGKIILLDEICGGRTPIQDDRHYFSGFGDDYQSPDPPYAVVWTKNGARCECGLIDKQLNYRPLLHDAFTDANAVRVCAEHVAVVHHTDGSAQWSCGLFNLKDDRLELPVEFSWIDPSNERIWAVARADDEISKDGRYSFYDVGKREFLPGSFTCAWPFSCGFGAVMVGKLDLSGRAYFVDEDLRPAFNVEFDGVGPFSHGLAAVYDDHEDTAGYIDTTGRMRLTLPYADLGRFSEFGLAIANRDLTEWDIDIIDREGRPRLSGLETADFSEGDFPYFEVTESGIEHLYDLNLNKIF